MDQIKEALSFAYGHSMTTYNGNLWAQKTSQQKNHRRRQPKIKVSESLNTFNAHQTRTTRINSTALCANGMRAGRLIAAADAQPPIRRLWLEYVYNPILDVYPMLKHDMELNLIPLAFGLWCFYPRTKTPPPVLMDAAGVFLYVVFHDAVQYARTGNDSRKTSSTYKAEQMGYGRGRQAYQSADYSRTWAPIERDLRAMFNELDQRAMASIRTMFKK